MNIVNRLFLRSILVLSLAFSIGINPCFAEERDAAFGSWGGLKDTLSEKGVQTEAVLTLDNFSNVSGGVELETATLGNFDLVMEIDTEKAKLWNGGTIFLYGLGNFGDPLSSYVGDFQATDNIEAYGTAK